MTSNISTDNLTNWNATKFFENLTRSNRLATDKNFVFCRVSGLEGFEEALGEIQQANNFVCASDIADGYTELNNTPRTRRVKTVFFAMRHALDDMAARAECFDVMQELFRQFMSVLILQRIKLEEQCIYIDPRITFNEIDRYFFSGCACAYFQVAVDKYTDLRYNADEWQDHYAEVGGDEHEYVVPPGPVYRYTLFLNSKGDNSPKTAIILHNYFGLNATEALEIVRFLPQEIPAPEGFTHDQVTAMMGELNANHNLYRFERSHAS